MVLLCGPLGRCCERCAWCSGVMGEPQEGPAALCAAARRQGGRRLWSVWLNCPRAGQSPAEESLAASEKVT